MPVRKKIAVAICLPVYFGVLIGAQWALWTFLPEFDCTYSRWLNNDCSAGKILAGHVYFFSALTIAHMSSVKASSIYLDWADDRRTGNGCE